MEEGYFSIKRDLQMVRNGGFICAACTRGLPASEQSQDPRYCLSCFEFLMDEASRLSPDRTKPKWVPVAAETPPDGATAQQEQVEAVTKILDKEIIPYETPEVIMLQEKGRGRPRKPEGELVSRMTKWRRAKESQGALL
jgi:hypothetical protein